MNKSVKKSILPALTAFSLITAKQAHAQDINPKDQEVKNETTRLINEAGTTSTFDRDRMRKEAEMNVALGEAGGKGNSSGKSEGGNKGEGGKSGDGGKGESGDKSEPADHSDHSGSDKH